MKANSQSNSIRADALAGYCMESALWKLLLQIAEFMNNHRPYIVEPADIIIQQDNFMLDDNLTESSEPDAVWNLAATICFISSGHTVFGQYGRDYQKRNPKAKLPVLQKEHAALTPIIHKCLVADEEKRISLAELITLAKKGLDDALKREKIRQPASENYNSDNNLNLSDIHSAWPEEMIDINCSV